MEAEKEAVREVVEPISLIGHTVRISDPYLLQFFYPNFSILKTPDGFEPYMNNIIYCGDYKLIAEFRRLGIDFIATGAPVAEYDLTSKEELVKFVFANHGKSLPKYLDSDVIASMSMEECINYCKMYWVSGIWFGPKESDALKIYEFHKSMCNDPFLVVLNIYYELDFDISLSVLKFLHQVVTQGDTKQGKYKELLIRASRQFGNRIKPSVGHYLKSPFVDKELRTFYLLFELLCPNQSV